ncbi:MAG TPA: hypothetical protein VHT03_09155 [Rhizomicrobium sp.]|nr:hypothetical protein [Rhizomicrobium sp.]
MGRVSKIVNRGSCVDLPARPRNIFAAESTSRQSGQSLVPEILRKLSLRAIWAARKAVVWAARSRMASFAATALSPVSRRRGILLGGILSQLRHRNDDHARFWETAADKYPDDPSVLRMRIHSALRAGDGASADAALGQLIALRRAKADDARFVVGLTNIDVHAGRQASIRFRIRSFMGSLRGSLGYRVAAVRLNRLVFAHFPRTERCSGSDARSRFLRMLDRSAVSREAKRLLRRVATCEEHLARLYPNSVFDTDISSAQRRAFVALVRKRLRDGRAFSFVRLGDGEAACLPYEPLLSSFAIPDARDRERIWWGRPLEGQLRSQIYPRLARAMFDADCIGIPAVSRFVRELRLQRDDTLQTTLTGRGLRAVLNCAENWEKLRSPGMPPPVFTSCHVHQDLELWNCYGELFDGVAEIVLVSCHEELGEWIHDRFGLKIAGQILLPPDRVTGPFVSSKTGDLALPAMLDEAIGELADLPRNRLVLVGAGLLGKLLVGEARARGGIALDLGSIFDHWLGFRTRSYLDLNAA